MDAEPYSPSSLRDVAGRAVSVVTARGHWRRGVPAFPGHGALQQGVCVHQRDGEKKPARFDVLDAEQRNKERLFHTAKPAGCTLLISLESRATAIAPPHLSQQRKQEVAWKTGVEVLSVPVPWGALGAWWILFIQGSCMPEEIPGGPYNVMPHLDG